MAPNIPDNLIQLLQAGAKIYNLKAGDGRVVPYQIIPFDDGSLPTAPPHNLPPLYNVDDILNLNDEDAEAYCQGYLPGVPVPDLIEDRRIVICREIGCNKLHLQIG